MMHRLEKCLTAIEPDHGEEFRANIRYHAADHLRCKKKIY